MPRVALHLTVVTCVLLAGCSALAPTATPTEEQPSNECPPSESYESKPLPEKPSNFTADSVSRFASAYEETIVWNDLVSRAETRLSSNGRAEVVNWTETGYVVHVTGSASYRTCTNGGTVVSDSWFDTNYFVNETTVVRLVRPEDRTTDPRTNGGEVVEQWNEPSRSS